MRVAIQLLFAVGAALVTACASTALKIGPAPAVAPSQYSSERLRTMTLALSAQMRAVGFAPCFREGEQPGLRFESGTLWLMKGEVWKDHGCAGTDAFALSDSLNVSGGTMFRASKPGDGLAVEKLAELAREAREDLPVIAQRHHVATPDLAIDELEFAPAPDKITPKRAFLAADARRGLTLEVSLYVRDPREDAEVRQRVAAWLEAIFFARRP